MLPGDRERVLRELGERLREAGYDEHGLRSLLGIRFPDDVGLLNHAPVLERLRGDGRPLAALVRLFSLEAREQNRYLSAAIPGGLARRLCDAGVLKREGGTTWGRVRLDAVGSLRLFADRRFREPDWKALGVPRGDPVYAPGADSVVLAEAVADMGADAALDLCSGSGVQGLAVAARAREVVGVDVEERAVALSRVNAVLNLVDNIDLRCGDLYTPARGQRFDLIVANPPFVPGPARGPSYHCGGPRGDRVAKRIVSGLQGHLRPGGWAAVVSHLALANGEEVKGVVRDWLTDFSGQCLVLILESGSVIDLAAAQSCFALDRGLASYATEFRDRLAWLRRRRLQTVLFLLLIARRGGRRRIDVLEAPQRTLPVPLASPPRTLIADWRGR